MPNWKALRKTVEILAGQTRNQIGMQMGVGVFHQPADVGGRTVIVLLAADACLHGRVEGLHADFQLQGTWGKLGNAFLERFRQMIRHDFEVGKDRILRMGRDLVQKELHDPVAALRVQIESAINEFELSRAARVKPFHLVQKRVEIETPGRFVQRRNAEFALERTAARCFDIKGAMRNVFRRVMTVGHRNLVQSGLDAGLNFLDRRCAAKNLATQCGKAHLSPSGDDVIGQSHDFL
jgi:hypothetical protein